MAAGALILSCRLYCRDLISFALGSKEPKETPKSKEELPMGVFLGFQFPSVRRCARFSQDWLYRPTLLPPLDPSQPPPRLCALVSSPWEDLVWEALSNVHVFATKCTV